MTDSKKTIRVIIPRDGAAAGTQNPRAIYSKEASAILSKLGKMNTTRASHVEPGSGLSHAARVILCGQALGCVNMGEWDPNTEDYEFTIVPEYESWWFADMTPTGHKVILGPFPPESRDAALAAEVYWLNEHGLPIPSNDGDTVKKSFPEYGRSITGRHISTVVPSFENDPETWPPVDTNYLMTLDYTNVEKSVLDRIRRRICRFIHETTFPEWNVTDYNDPSHDDINRYWWFAIIEPESGLDSQTFNMSVTFEPGTCRIMKQTCKPKQT